MPITLELTNTLGLVTHSCTNVVTNYYYNDISAIQYNAGTDPSTISYDGNDATYQGCDYGGQAANESYGTAATITSLHTFKEPVRITQLKYHVATGGDCSGSYEREWHIVQTVSYQLADGWHTVHTDSGDGGGNSSHYNDSGYVTDNTILENVLAVKAYAYAASFKRGGAGHAGGYARIYEIQAFGFPYLKTGVQV